jgi:hypothetical protein
MPLYMAAAVAVCGGRRDSATVMATGRDRRALRELCRDQEAGQRRLGGTGDQAVPERERQHVLDRAEGVDPQRGRGGDDR